MKKTLVAVAAMAAIAGAHADVTITGVMEAAIASTNGVRTVSGGTNGGSEISFGVNEDLGSGLKAFATTTIIQDLADPAVAYTGVAPTAGSSTATNSTSPLAQYQSWIGLSGDFGSIKLGQFWSNTFLASTVGDAAGRAAVSNYLAGGAQGQIANSLGYTSPTISGLSASYQKAMDTTVVAEQYYSYSINYTNGALNAAYGYGKAKTGTSTATNEQIFGANYDLGAVKLFVGVATTSYTGASTASTQSSGYGAAIPLGASTFSLALGSGSGNVNNYQVQYKYDFSKKTNGYIHYANGTTTANPVTTTIGIKHNF